MRHLICTRNGRTIEDPEKIHVALGCVQPCKACGLTALVDD